SRHSCRNGSEADWVDSRGLARERGGAVLLALHDRAAACGRNWVLCADCAAATQVGGLSLDVGTYGPGYFGRALPACGRASTSDFRPAGELGAVCRAHAANRGAGLVALPTCCISWPAGCCGDAASMADGRRNDLARHGGGRIGARRASRAR